jgi:hypothetical protein
MTYRPWGLLDWALDLSKPRRWNFIGALGTEVRSLAAWEWLTELGVLLHYRLLEIHDLESRYTALAIKLLHDREEAFRAAGGVPECITHSMELLTELHRIIRIARGVEAATDGSVILDITSLPKRFFFPLLRHFAQSDSVRNLIVTYASAAKYSEAQPLSENAADWLNLPGFHGEDGEPETLVVGVGFMVENLQSHIAEINKHESIKMLIPFPAPLSILRRTWESVYRLESGRSREKFEHHRVATNDMSAAFDRIASLALGSSANLAFAPFGPKPISASMCLYASQHECAVYYPQPRVYNPEYSMGVAEIDGKRAVFAYWVKHDGQNLYSV